jgi:hypothetical protein
MPNADRRLMYVSSVCNGLSSLQHVHVYDRRLCMSDSKHLVHDSPYLDGFGMIL